MNFILYLTFFLFLKPASVSSVNGGHPHEDDEDSSTEDAPGVNGIVARDGRSVSSTVHDRSAIPTGKQSSSSKHHHSQSHRHSIAHSPPAGTTGTSPSTARETFLNYFFGQNGPGPIAGSSLDRSHGPQHVPIGRDTSKAEVSMPSGLMAGKRSLDGNNAAFDMKSLGKHIEAVSCVTPTALQNLIQTLGRSHRKVAPN